MKNLHILAALLFLGVVTTTLRLVQSTPASAASANRIQVVFAGGHETDERDKGRPVILIASALGVPPEVFREAFSHVHPAPAGQHPDPEDVRRNKEALLQVLAPYGVTNERLDEVSNYYRYNRSRGEMWPTENAVAYALLKEGKVTGFEIERGGSGYSSAPTVTVPGIKGEFTTTQLGFSPTFEQNGAIKSIGWPQNQK